MPGFADLKDRASNVFGGVGFEKFEMPKQGYDQMDGAAVGGAYQTDTGGNDSPMSFEEIERPPLRHVDKYVRAECPCIKTTRYTISLMTCLGFIISFGMRCNMGMAKLQFENGSVKYQLDCSDWRGAVDSSLFWVLPSDGQVPVAGSLHRCSRQIASSVRPSLSRPFKSARPGAMMLHDRCDSGACPAGLVEGVTYPACTYLALLGTTARTFPAGNDGIQRFVCRCRDRYANVRHSNRFDQLARPILLLRCDGSHMVLLLVVVIVRETTPTSNHLREGAKVHRKVTRRIGTAADANHSNDTVASLPDVDARVCDHCGKLLPVVELLPVGTVPSAYLKHSFNFRIEETGTGSTSTSADDDHRTIRWYVGGSHPKVWHPVNHQRAEAVQLWRVRSGGSLFLGRSTCHQFYGCSDGLNVGSCLQAGSPYPVYNVNHLDIAPRYASILMGMSNGIGTIAGLICPIAIDHLTRGQPKSCWSCVHDSSHGTFGRHYILRPFLHRVSYNHGLNHGRRATCLGSGWFRYEKETTFNDAGDGGTAGGIMDPMAQINATKTVSYGAVQQHVANNPFAYPNAISEEPVQPEARDTYLHGNPTERTY
uniref:Uncharacterized protein n=1 Tax=Anopheles funestus TaxID=62324 RepID=A0A182RFJ1_ANOFN